MASDPYHLEGASLIPSSLVVSCFLSEGPIREASRPLALRLPYGSHLPPHTHGCISSSSPSRIIWYHLLKVSLVKAQGLVTTHNQK